MQCVGGVWKRSALYAGPSTDSCDASHAGQVAYFSSAVVGCNGTNWINLVDGSIVEDTFTKLLLHFENGATDSSSTPHTSSGASITYSNSIYKFGAYSGVFNGANGYVNFPDSTDWDFGSGDFTIDFWYRAAATGGYRGIASRQCAGTSWPAWTINDNGSGYVDFIFCSTGNCGATWETFTGLGGTNLHLGTPEVNVWHHYAVVRSGTTFYGFKDGALVSSGTNATTIAAATGSAMCLGLYASNYLNGYIDEFRISKGVARWTSAFTPPTAPY